jgi:hypothetical protein
MVKFVFPTNMLSMINVQRHVYSIFMRYKDVIKSSMTTHYEDSLEPLRTFLNTRVPPKSKFRYFYKDSHDYDAKLKLWIGVLDHELEDLFYSLKAQDEPSIAYFSVRIVLRLNPNFVKLC